MKEDRVSKIMKKRKGLSADEMSSEYDYLEVADLDNSSTNSGAADGDFLGNEQKDEDERDIVALVMKKRKAQHNPKPA